MTEAISDKPANADAPKATPEPGEKDKVVIPDKFKLEDGSVNQEAILKSYLEIESLSGRQGSELDNLRKDNESLRDSKQTAELLAQVVENTAKPTEEGRPDLQAWVDSRAEDWSSDPKLMASELLTTLSGWQQEDQNSAKAYADSQLSEIKKQNEALAQKLELLDPSVQPYSKVIGELQAEHGLNLSQAKAMAQKLAEAKGEHEPGRIDPPASVTSSRVTAPPGATGHTFSESDRDKYLRLGWSAEEIAEAEETQKARSSV